ncbi:MAG: ATP-binding protein [Bacteroidetes bacterium]|nr:ATP-binding protein [Bacteroidota bacterium]
MIIRDTEKELLYLLKHFPAVCILGPRQCGKTTLAKAMVPATKRKTLHLDLEKQSDVVKLHDAEAFLEEQKEMCVVIDEVQTMPALFKALRPLIDEYRKPGRFVLLGSASPELVRGVSESLAGRIAYVELSPFSISELDEKFVLNKHWFRGGFPLSYLAKSNAIALKWMDDFIRTYVERDLNVLFNTTFPRQIMNRFWQMLAHFHGGIWKAETFAGSLGVTAPTINRYLEFLEGAFIIHRLSAYAHNTKKRLVKAPKIYIRDTGLLHRLLSIETLDALMGNPQVGNSWEGYVVEEIRKQLPKNLRMYYYRTHDGAECDVVLEKGNKIVACIEIKLSNAPTVSKGFHYCIAELKSKQNFVITPNADTYPHSAIIKVCGVVDFIKKELPKL